MIAQPLDPPAKLVNFDGDPRGRRYSALDREHAYLTWTLAGRRSFTKTGELTGVAPNTLRAWHDQDRWAERADGEDDEARKMARVALAAKVVDETAKSLETIIAIRDDATASKRDRLAAAIYILGVSGIAPVVKAENPALFDPETKPAPKPPRDLRSLSDAELLALERGEDIA
jgi:hypothetical protein